MNKFLIIAFFVGSALSASEAYTPIAYGIKSQGMGGVSIATTQGAESLFANPALLSMLKTNELSIASTYQRSEPKFKNVIGDSLDTSSDTLSPYFCTNYHLLSNLTIGVGVSDYTLKNRLAIPNDTVLKIKLQKTRVILPVSYAVVSNFSVGASLIYEKSQFSYEDTALQESEKSNNGSFGYDIGISYKIDNIGLTFAVDYKSKIRHDSKEFGLNSAAEIATGIDWKIYNTPHEIALDYKRIDASTLAPLAVTTIFQDQNVFAIGYSYNAKQYQLRAGYRYVSDIYTNDDSAILNLFFPFLTTSHYTVGGSYIFNKKLSIDLSLLYETYSRKATEDQVELWTMENNPILFSVGLNYYF